MDVVLFVIYVSCLFGIGLWFRSIAQREVGKKELSWKLHWICFFAAFGLPIVIVGALSFTLKILLWFLL